MKKKLFYGLLLIVLVITALFVYEGMAFKRYLTHQKGGDMNIPINNLAPVKSEGEIEISAPVNQVWQVLTNIDNWPSWQTEVTEAHLLGELEEGTSFKWKAGGLHFSSNIHTIVPKTSFGWTGKTIGASAVHNWYFEEQAGKTVVRVEESLQGVFPRLFSRYFQKNLDKGIQQNLTDLKMASEK